MRQLPEPVEMNESKKGISPKKMGKKMEHAYRKHDMTTMLVCKHCKTHTTVLYVTDDGSYCSKDCFWTISFTKKLDDNKPASILSYGTGPTEQHALRTRERICSHDNSFCYRLF